MVEALLTYQAHGGYSSAYDEFELPALYMGEGSENLLPGPKGRVEVFKGLTDTGTGGRVLFNVGDHIASLNDYTSGSLIKGSGTIVGYTHNSLFYAGAGRVYFDDLSLGAAASSTLAMLLESNNSYTDPLSGPYQVGLAQPSAPGLTTKTPSAGLTGFSAAISAQATRIRSYTGGESVRSPASVVIVTNSETALVSFPLPDSNGQDRWGLYLPHHGFPFGPYFLFREILLTELATIDGYPRAIEIDYNDAQLQEILAPLDLYPPPASTHLAHLEDVLAAIGGLGDISTGVTTTSGGTCVAPSVPGKPEGYPPDWYMFLIEAPVHVLPVADGYSWILGNRSVTALSYVGGPERPLRLQLQWPTTGIDAPHNACIADGVLYLATHGGPARMGPLGQVDREWAADVRKDMKAWILADTICGHHLDDNFVVYGCGRELFAYSTLRDVWSAKLKIPNSIPGNILSCVTDGKQLKITLDNGGTLDLYKFNVGAGTTAKYVSGWLSTTDETEMRLFDFRGSMTLDNIANQISFTFHANGDGATAVKSFTETAPRTGLVHFRPWKINLINILSLRLSITFTSTGGDSGIRRFFAEGRRSRNRQV